MPFCILGGKFKHPMKQILLLVSLTILFSCKENTASSPADETSQTTKETTIQEREYAVLDSKVLNTEALWKPFQTALDSFADADYNRVKDLAFEKSIPEIQAAIAEGKLSYEELTLFYLSRIKKYDRNNALSLNSVIALNPKVLEEARKLDENRIEDLDPYSIYGMPILLKDNINAEVALDTPIANEEFVYLLNIFSNSINFGPSVSNTEFNAFLIAILSSFVIIGITKGTDIELSLNASFFDFNSLSTELNYLLLDNFLLFKI